MKVTLFNFLLLTHARKYVINSIVVDLKIHVINSIVVKLKIHVVNSSHVILSISLLLHVNFIMHVVTLSPLSHEIICFSTKFTKLF